MLIEILWRGYTFWQMFVVGGICGITIGLINEKFSWDTPLWEQGIVGMFICDILEFTSGCYLNLYLGLNIWSYCNMPFNLFGQICLYYSIAWLGVSILAIMLDDLIRWKFFGEEKPRYKLT